MISISFARYVFLDEVQNIDVFQCLVDGLFIKKNVDLHIICSNHYLRSGELATLLTGRYIPTEILLFSDHMAMKKSPNLQKLTNLTERDTTDESAKFLKLQKKESYGNLGENKQSKVFQRSVLDAIVEKDGDVLAAIC
jgi:predicted AAA+ superfamily ATPase